MDRLPILSGREIVNILGVVGYEIVRRRGSHIRLSCPERKSVTVPDYKTVSRGLLVKILRDARISHDDFIRLYKT